MTQVFTQTGVEYISQSISGDTSAVLTQVAVGSGTDPVAPDDTAMQNEVYRGSTADPNISISSTSNNGRLLVEADVTGGNQVPSGTSITEFGLFTDDGRFVFHEVKDQAVIVGSGDTVSFTKPIAVIDGN